MVFSYPDKDTVQPVKRPLRHSSHGGGGEGAWWEKWDGGVGVGVGARLPGHSWCLAASLHRRGSSPQLSPADILIYNITLPFILEYVYPCGNIHLKVYQ